MYLCVRQIFAFVFLLVRIHAAALLPEELLSLQSPEQVIYLNEENFHDLISGPRPYYVSLLFTAMGPQINCAQCHKFDAHYKRVASSYYASSYGRTDIFFFIADFEDNQKIYNQLQITQVPRLWVFPPSEDPLYNVTSEHYPFTLSESALNDVLEFANFISRIVGTSIVVNAEFDPTQFFSYFFLTFFGVLLLRKKVIEKMNKRSIFSYLTVLTIIVFISGYMFTVIRGIPFIAKNEKEEIMYYSGGTHWQFGLETVIISSIYIVLIGFFASLVIFIPRVTDEKRRTVLVVSCSILLFYVFNYLTQIFQIKDPGYPFRLTEYF